MRVLRGWSVLIVVRGTLLGLPAAAVAEEVDLKDEAYTFGSCFSGRSWVSVRSVVDGLISQLTAINLTKPIIVLQTAAPRSCDGKTGGDVRGIIAIAPN